MPARPPAWLTPEDEAHELVEELIRLNLPRSVLDRAERIKMWTQESRQTFAAISTLSHGGRFCDTALNQARQTLDSAPWQKPKLTRLRRE
jgi:hypothetical protein